jgi:hypothetical protein
MQIAIGAIGIGIVLMVGYIVIANVRTALPTPDETYVNACQGYLLNDTTNCNTTAVSCGPISDNSSAFVTCASTSFSSGISSTQATVFAGFGLVAVSIIVLAAFGLINIFK